MLNKIQKLENGLAKDFKSTLTKREKDLIFLSNNENIIAGTEDNPLVNNSKKVPVHNFFMDGVYVRGMTMYKGTVVVGAIHKTLHMCFLLEGHLTVANEDGIKEHIAPCYIISKPGVKRVLYAHEDSVWYNTHKNPTNTKDIRELEKELVAMDYEEYEQYINKINKL